MVFFKRVKSLALAAAVLIGSLGWGVALADGERRIQSLSEAEFRSLAEKLAPKVTLFSEVWSADPKAEFYGGTTRDYLYWLKGQFREIKSQEEARKKIKELEGLKAIDVRDFIIGDSDIDVISERSMRIDPGQFGVRSVDLRGPAIFDPTTELGRNELDQGYIPAEKIRLGSKGFVRSPSFKDGVQEIYNGRLTVEFADPERFARSHYAKQKLNHPVLLALRYLRLQAMDYYQSFGSGFPDRKLLLDMDRKSAESVRKVIESTLDGRELKEYLAQDQFRGWLNGTIQKAFRSYTNPTAAMELMKDFKVEMLIPIYEGIEPINQYLFAKARNEAAVQTALKQHAVNTQKLFRPVREEFPDGVLYHGTQSGDSFRGILIQGVLPSARGAAGSGLYGVAAANQKFAEEWGGNPDLLVGFEVSPDARIVDITQGEGEKLWRSYYTRSPKTATYEQFADLYGIDIISYPYEPRAYVVKNSAVLSKPRGIHRSILSFSKAMDLANRARTKDEIHTLAKSLSASNFSVGESRLLLSELERTGAIKSIIYPESFKEALIPIDMMSQSDVFSRALSLEYGERILRGALSHINSFEEVVEYNRALEKIPVDDRKRLLPPKMNQAMIEEWEGKGFFSHWKRPFRSFQEFETSAELFDLSNELTSELKSKYREQFLASIKASKAGPGTTDRRGTHQYRSKWN